MGIAMSVLDKEEDMQNNILTLEEFQSVMDEWYRCRQYQVEVNAILNKHGGGAVVMPDCSWGLQMTLEKMFGDDKEAMSNIEYFVYELDFGKKYQDGMIKDGEGNYIKMGTVANLYDVLMKEMSNNGE